MVEKMVASEAMQAPFHGSQRAREAKKEVTLEVVAMQAPFHGSQRAREAEAQQEGALALVPTNGAYRLNSTCTLERPYCYSPLSQNTGLVFRDRETQSCLGFLHSTHLQEFE